MKTDIHPDYNTIVFRDLTSGETFLTRSTAKSEKTIEWEDGNTYPVIDVEISSASHPFIPASSVSSTPLVAWRSSTSASRASDSNYNRTGHSPLAVKPASPRPRRKA